MPSEVMREAVECPAVEEDSGVEEPSFGDYDGETFMVPKKRGRKKGATGYSHGDGTAVLDNVEYFLPSQDEDWEKVASRYNLNYAKKYSRTERTGKALRTRFRELLWGKASGGGRSGDLQERAREILKKIDSANGMLRSDGALVTPNSPAPTSSSLSPAPSTSSPISTPPSNASPHANPAGRSGNAAFRKSMLDYLERSEREESIRHAERMALFSKLLEKL